MQRRADNQIVGLCRFSYPATGGFRLSGAGLEAVIATLYEPGRMRRRFAYFENVCLPSLAAQTDPDFTLVVLAGDMMPLRWRRRLKALRATYPFMRICALQPLGPLQAARRGFRFGAREEVPFVTGFRIDDDDAVAVDYVERLRETSDRMLQVGWADAETPVAIGFQTGLFWDLDEDGLPVYRHSETHPLGQASAMITPYDFRHNIFRWNHAHLLAHVRLWADPSPEMFVRTLHGGNDSGRTRPARAERLDDHEAATLLRDRFGLAPQRIRPLLARLAQGAPSK
ncbi:glycosyltransferase [Roseibacterium sp. SDUM158017]|uniref:glycosyltransferase n=1 Tax=Roseicyclus salinarum TaxID=3036773 RepID=UPI002414F732|nr:glycosyltransferase [Roseibacterium sp. SDUM158017]MDG4650302.1 glycosyltransferase [Roseibacterium sp. SDUM158017]